MKYISLVLLLVVQLKIFAQPSDWVPVTYTNSTTIYSVVTIDGISASEADVLAAFVDNECRAVGNIILNEGQSYCVLLIQGSTPETVNFKLWDASEDVVLDIPNTVQSIPGGTLGSPPNYIELIAGTEGTDPCPAPFPVQVITYTNSTTIYGIVTINGNDATELDSVAAYVGSECRGKGVPIMDNGTAYITMVVQGNVAEEVEFRVWDASECQVYTNALIVTSSPGNTLGNPPNYLQVEAGTHGTEPCPAPFPVSVVTYTNSTTMYCSVTINDTAATILDSVAVFVGNECRGKGVPSINKGVAYVTMVVQGDVPEEVEFRVWDASACQVYTEALIVTSSPGNSLGTPPNYLHVEAGTHGPNPCPAPFPVSVVSYSNSTTMYGKVTINNVAATPLDSVAAFVGEECRGKGIPVMNKGNAYVTIDVQGDVEEEVEFRVWDASECHVYSDALIVTSSPGNSLGTPPNYLPIDAETPNTDTCPAPYPQPVVRYSNSTTVYGVVSINGVPATALDSVAAFVGNECRAKAVPVVDKGNAHVTLSVQGNVSEPVEIRIWDASECLVYRYVTTITSNPGGKVGTPPNYVIFDPSYFNPCAVAFSQPLVIYSNSTHIDATLSIDGVPASELDSVAAFVGNECRAKGAPHIINDTAFVSLDIQGDSREEVEIRVWDASNCEVYRNALEFISNPGGSLGNAPDYLEIVIGSPIVVCPPPFPQPVVTYTNSTTLYGIVTVGGEPAKAEDSVAAYVGNECRGKAIPVVYNGTAYVTLVIQGHVPENVEIRVWDESECEVYRHVTSIISSPGDNLGYPPDYIQIGASHNRPIAIAGADIRAYRGDTVYLDGISSTTLYGDTLYFSWQAPEEFELDDYTSITPSFIVPDNIDLGEYEFVLTVNDGIATSAPDTVIVSLNRSSDAHLFELSVQDPFELVEDFDSALYVYHVIVEEGSVEFPQVSAIAFDSRAVISIEQASAIGDTAVVTVTAENTSVVVQYLVIIQEPVIINNQVIQFHEGLNFISLYLTPEYASIDSIFKGMLENVEKIVTDDGFYAPHQPSYFNSLQQFTDGKAYLVSCRNAFTLTVNGELFSVEAIQGFATLQSGWNYVGCPFYYEAEFSELYDLNSFSIIKNFEGFYQSENPELNSIHNFVPGAGYFILAK